MKKEFCVFWFFVACLMVFQIGCAPRTPGQSPIDNDNSSTTGQPQGVRAPITANYGEYAGRYRIQGADIEYSNVIVENERLYGQAGDQPRMEFIPGSDRDLFNVQGMEEVQIKFNRNDQNRVTSFEIITNEGTQRAEKVE